MRLVILRRIAAGALAAAYVALVAWTSGFPPGEGEPLDAGELLGVALYWTVGPSCVVGALLGRRAAVLPLAGGVVAAVLHGASPGVALHAVAGAAVVLGAARGLHRPAAAGTHAPFGAVRTLAVALVAAGVPLALGLGWAASHVEPPAWTCFAARPAGHAEAADRYLRGAGATVAAATIALVCGAGALSRWRLRRETGSARPGAPTDVLGALLCAYVLAAAAWRPALDALADGGLVLLLAAPVTVSLLALGVVWAARRPRGLRAVGLLTVAVWTSAIATPVFAGGAIAGAAGPPALCLD